MNRQKTKRIVKFVASNVLGFSASFAVATLIRQNVEPKNKLQEAELYLGAMACGAVASDIVHKHVSREVDNTFMSIAEARAEIKQARQE